MYYKMTELERKFRALLSLQGLSLYKWAAENKYKRASVYSALAGDRRQEHILNEIQLWCNDQPVEIIRKPKSIQKVEAGDHE